jgi:hypothetical protein
MAAGCEQLLRLRPQLQQLLRKQTIFLFMYDSLLGLHFLALMKPSLSAAPAVTQTPQVVERWLKS